MDAVGKRPNKIDQKTAKKSAEMLKSITDGSSQNDSLEFQVEGSSISVPTTAVLLLEKVLNEMAEGKTVEIASFSQELSTQEAADMLNVSRPHLVKLLEAGKIPHKKVGAHRRVLFDDVKRYQDLIRENRKRALDELAKEAQEMGLGY
jgi:excisionase family DNA binding protein